MNATPRLPYNLRLIPFLDALPIKAFAALPDALCRIERWRGGPLLVGDDRSGKAAAWRSLTLLLTDPCSSTTLDLNNTGDQTP